VSFLGACAKDFIDAVNSCLPARYGCTGRRFRSFPGGKHPATETTLEDANSQEAAISK